MIDRYRGFGEEGRTRRALMAFLMDARGCGKRTTDCGTPGKGNTVFDYRAIGTDFIGFSVNANLVQQGAYALVRASPSSRPGAIRAARPDRVLPWNLKDDIGLQSAYAREGGGRSVVPIPEVRVLD